MIEIGNEAPSFELMGMRADSELPEPYTLAEATANGPAILVFYSFDFHPTCRAQMCRLDDLSWFGIASDVTVLGISTDQPFSHKEFANREGLTYPLLCDQGAAVTREYGLVGSARGVEPIAKRATCIVDTGGVIRYTWVADRQGDPTDLPPIHEMNVRIKEIDGRGSVSG
jgi:peroxiredoxin